ncbi:ricin-type beta-trefoil lectin domain protein [Catenuloplanes indicus]|uniref:ricin-type beta-trefoil lectin domain protein n=1 Tax=Catenuloplanes indicus TaxID=137267 RepID=UPI0035205902
MRSTGLWRRRARTLLIGVLTTTLVVTGTASQGLALPPDNPARGQSAVQLPELPEIAPIAEKEDAEKDLTTAPENEIEPYAPTAVTPWQAGTGTADLTGVEAGESLPIAGTPVSIGVPEGGDPADLAGTWKVDLAAPEASQTAGVPGLIMKVTPPAAADPEASVALSVDYTAFADLYGPQAADRFGMMLLPDCVYDAPASGECAPSTEDPAPAVRSDVEVIPPPANARSAVGERRVVTGAVPLSGLLDGAPAAANARAAAAASSGVVGALDTGASSAGDFTATPLLSSGSWAAGQSSGAFTYSYQVHVPETAGGLNPKVALGYSSQTVDGRTSATNNQASWIGDGWDYSAGSITRTYTSCAQDSKTPGANNKDHRSGDMCWGSHNATLSLGGSTTELVWDDNKWTTANGDGSVITQVKDNTSGNGAWRGEYWVVTTRDGTKYHFGRNRLPGWTEGKPVTNSVLNVPVFGNHSNEDCYQLKFADSSCYQGWRWSLDYVEDVHGNAMSFWWEKEGGYYARNFGWNKPVAYDRGGYLTRIDYGQRADTIFSAPVPASVAFSVAERCFDEDGLTCTDANFASKDPGKYRIWYDTPADLNCVAGKQCWNANPSFYSRKRLDKITTSAQRHEHSTARQTVDEYQLRQSFPILKTGPNTALWLESILRTGYDRAGAAGQKITLNPVRFESNPEDMPNRVKDDSRPSFSRLRIARVINEYGGETVVTYKLPEGDCKTGQNLPRKDQAALLKSNNRLCYPTYWHPDPAVEDIDWFHKYVVESVEELPNVLGAHGTKTAYAYDGAAWRLADAEFSKKSTRTYSQFAGFAKTTVLSGVDDPAIGSRRTKAVTRYFQGLGDDVTVEDSAGVEIAKDREPFAGRVAEELTYSSATAADSDWLTRSVTYPEATELARRNRADGVSPLIAWRITEPRQKSWARSSGTGDDKRTTREVETKTTFEGTYGLPTFIESLGDTGKSGDESCTRTTYYHQTGRNLIGLTQEMLASPTLCENATWTDLKSLAGGGRTAYDGKAFGVAPADNSRGLVTETFSLKADGTGFQSGGTTEFDAIGRVIATTDVDGKKSTMEYRPATGQAFWITTKNSLGHTQTQEVEPGRATTLKTTDLNGHVSEARFDALGRLVEAWSPGRTPTATTLPDFKAVYTTPAGSPPYVTTYTRGHENKTQVSVTLYDGLGRERQSQEEAVGGGRLITDTLYNSSGEVWQSNNAYFATGKPEGSLFTPLADTAIPNMTRYTYDGMGRVLEELPVLNGSAKPERATRYEYGLDHSTVINPAGSSSYRIWSDANGRTTRIDTFTDAARTTFTSMRYEFDTRGQMVKARHSEDPDRPWSWGFDQRGRMIVSTDPDAGTSTTTYDHRDRPVTTTNARGVTTWTGYDELSRPIAQRLGSATGQLLAGYTYDTAPGGVGLPASVTRYTNNEAYTQTVGGYTNDYQPTSTTLTLPQSVADTWGFKTSYTYSYTYTDTGLPESSVLPAVGSLPSEKLLVRYSNDGLPLSVSGQDWYGTETVYSPYGQVVRSTLGSQPYRVWALADYDEASGELKRSQVFREQTGNKLLVSGNLVSQRDYAYDAAGNITDIQERSTGIEERQCFTYDARGQLTKAWTSKNVMTCGSGPVATDGTVLAGAGVDKTGYWQEYTYDLLGNRTKLVEKDLTGDTAKDATTTYSYGAADGSQPRTLTKVGKKYTTPAGAQVTAEATRLYELTGETKSVTSIQNGDKQELSWTYDGQIESITGQGGTGKTEYVGLGGKCLDLKSGVPAAGVPLQHTACNGTLAQKFTFTPAPGQSNPNLGTLSILQDWCVVPAGSTAGSALQVQKCDGTAAQQVARNTSGQLIHQPSGLCIAVQNTSGANGTPVVLATCGAGAEQKWEPQNQTRHIYGPGGSRLITVQGRQATLMLGETTLTVQTGGVQVSVQRNYAAPGGGVMRYTNASGSGMVAVASDPQGTPSAEVALADGMETRIRKQDPFGNQRGVATLGSKMETKAGYLGATPDDASGYVPLGARLYDPVVGRFLSADPLLDLADPVQNNGYSYAHNNPMTLSDPSGLSVALSASEMDAAYKGAGLSTAQVAQAQAAMNSSLVSVILGAAWNILAEFLGINDAINCFGGDMWACGSLIIGAVPWGKIAKIPKIAKAIDLTISAVRAWQTARKIAERVIAAAKAAEAAFIAAKKLAAEKAKKAAQAAAKKAADLAKTASAKAADMTKKTGNPAQKSSQAKANPTSSSAASSGGGGGKKPAAPASKGDDTSGGGRSDGGSSGGSCQVPDNSFVPGTRVLMADGTSKPIEEVKTGDAVQATEAETGETQTKTVIATITGHGVKHLVKIVIDTDGERGTDTAAITATDGHPFWVPELGQWLDATDLQPGQWLQTSAGTWIQIAAIDRWTTQSATVHNLAISDIHTYYVLAGSTPALAHNCNVALGQKKAGTYQWAEQEGFEHYGNLSPDEWMGPVKDDIRNSKITLHVNLEEMGSFAESARVGFLGSGGGADLEMSWIATAVMRGERSWKSVLFYRKVGDVMTEVSVPEPDWSQFTPYKWWTDPPTECRCSKGK